MAKAKLVKVKAVVDFDIDDKQEGAIRLWGVDFVADKGDLVAEVSSDEAKAMKAAKRVK